MRILYKSRDPQQDKIDRAEGIGQDLKQFVLSRFQFMPFRMAFHVIIDHLPQYFSMDHRLRNVLAVSSSGLGRGSFNFPCCNLRWRPAS